MYCINTEFICGDLLAVFDLLPAVAGPNRRSKHGFKDEKKKKKDKEKERKKTASTKKRGKK